MWNELGISGGTAIVILIALYFVIKWAVKNGIKEAYSAITGKKTDEDVRNEKELKELGFEVFDKYKIGEKTKFSTYAYFWIEQKIGRYVSKDTYRASHHLIYLFKEMKKFKGTQEEFFKKKGLNEKTIGALRQMGINKELEFTEVYGVRDLSTLEEIDRFILRDYLEDIMSQHCTPKEIYILEKIFFSPSLPDKRCTRSPILVFPK